MELMLGLSLLIKTAASIVLRSISARLLPNSYHDMWLDRRYALCSTWLWQDAREVMIPAMTVWLQVTV